MNLPAKTLSQAAALIRDGEITPLDLTQACLQRIEELDPRLNAFISLTAEAALEQAEQATQEIRQGSYRGALHGIPLAIKDIYDLQGTPTTAGSTFFGRQPASEDAWAISRLRQAGVVFLGKLNMHEIALGVTNVNPHYGGCHNPWDLNRVSGGSSGGSAAALAAQLCLGSLGTDTGGSIRIPSALCGIVGLKPTYGRVSLRGVLPLSWSLDHAGPLARSVQDVSFLLQAICGYDALDPVCVDRPDEECSPAFGGSLHGWRILRLVGEYFTPTDPDVLAAVDRAADVFSQLGCQVFELELPDLYLAARTNGMLVVCEAAAVHRESLQEHPDGFGADIRQRLQDGSAVSASDLVLARRTQVELRRRFMELLPQRTLFLLPTTPTSAPLIVGPDAIESARRLTRFTAPFNLTGLPAISLPCGFDQQGLPVGMQLVAGEWEEAALLQAADAFEGATSWHLHDPMI